MGKRAIVIGATGLVGQSLIDQLADADHITSVTTLTRRPAEHPCSKIHNQVVNFDHLEDHASCFRADLLFSCLGTTRKQAGSAAAQRRVDLDYQFTAAELAARHGVSHYLLVSSSGANRNSRHSYLQMKGQLEYQIQTLGFDRISIFQPSLLKGKRTSFRLGETMGSLLLPAICKIPGLQRFRPITGQQVAAKMIHASQQPGPALEWFRLDEIFAG